MATAAQSDKKWIEIGRSATSERENRTRAEVKLDDYYVVIAFEVNKPEAFKDNIHDVAKDYGHALFYVVKNGKVCTSFSFGPAGIGKTGWFKDGEINARPADADYLVYELLSAFRIRLTPPTGRKLEMKTNEKRVEVQAGKEKYTAYMNDTCAESARDILSSAGVDTPSATGPIKDSRKLSFPIAYAANPYMWHHNFKKNAHREVKFNPPLGGWAPVIQEKDPIFGSAS